jgi:threonine dehydrogenase-like Zn-dependent dehydrogenase
MVRQEVMPVPQAGQVLMRTKMSAISAGTEMLFYRNHLDEGIQLDAVLGALKGTFGYPFKYGYSTVGEVIGLGPEAPEGLMGMTAFCFHPHESHFLAAVNELYPLPEGTAVEDAVFLPAMETALSFAMDGRPLAGEKVVILGQGVIGLLTTAVLARFPLGQLITLDKIELRRDLSLKVGALNSFDPSISLGELFHPSLLGKGKADLVFEVSGNPDALGLAMSLTGYEGRIVLGSWYGNRPSTTYYGREFHRDRLQIIGSQVSTIGSHLCGRWGKERRIEFAWKLISMIKPSTLITHRVDFESAPSAYKMIDQEGEDICQMVLIYD